MDRSEGQLPWTAGIDFYKLLGVHMLRTIAVLSVTLPVVSLLGCGGTRSKVESVVSSQLRGLPAHSVRCRAAATHAHIWNCVVAVRDQPKAMRCQVGADGSSLRVTRCVIPVDSGAPPPGHLK
jgi:hypothetical protein